VVSDSGIPLTTHDHEIDGGGAITARGTADLRLNLRAGACANEEAAQER
jgi:hypothetical protein